MRPEAQRVGLTVHPVAVHMYQEMGATLWKLRCCAGYTHLDRLGLLCALGIVYQTAGRLVLIEECLCAASMCVSACSIVTQTWAMRLKRSGTLDACLASMALAV